MALPEAGHIIQFAGYQFPGAGLSFSPSFGDVVTRTGRLPGLDGGFDEYGTGQAPGEVGNITMSFTLIASDREDMQELRDEVLALKRKGKKELRWKPPGFTKFRFCHARINNIRMSQNPAGHTDLHQSVSINFQVSDPCWYSYPFEVWYLDGSVLLDGSRNLAGWGEDFTLELNSSESTVLEVDGTADTFPVIWVVPSIEGEYPAFDLRRFDENGALQDEVKITRALADDYLEINCRKYSVTWRTRDVGFDLWHKDWIPYIIPKRAEFFRLVPGNNYLKISVSMDDGILCRFEYLEAWR